MSRLVHWSLIPALICLAPAGSFAQGQQSGTLSGRVSSADRLPLPGVTVVVTSAALQGRRTVLTDVNGVYSLPGLPPGRYVVRFELQGMASVERGADVPLGNMTVLDQQLMVAPVSEFVDVRAAAPSAVTSRRGVSTRTSESTLLPVGRTPFLLAETAPGLTDNTPNGSQVTVSGAFAYDNVFLMNGVDINDNVLGTPNTLFIEEAIQEVQVLTSGISPEYGRFSGGVINVITRSGGNTFAGGVRTNFTNPSWSAETPLEKSAGTSRASRLSHTFEGTAGGPVVHDRLWFFGGARTERTTGQSSFAQTRLPFTTTNENTRYEAKLTGTLAPGHTLQGSVIESRANLHQPSLGASIDPSTFSSPSTPNRIFAATWRGVLGSRTLAEAQYSRKDWQLKNAGGTSAAVMDSPFITRGVLGVPANLHYNGPYFDSSDPESRDNRQLTASVSHLMSSRGLGTHEVKGGVEYFTSTRVGGNSQSLSGYVFQSDYRTGADGRPELDASGRLVPRFVPGTSRLQTWMPQRGAAIDVTTASGYVNDHWTAGPRLTFDVGARYERARSEATGDIAGARGNTIVPRLAAAYDVTADGRTVVQATYGHYAGKYNDVQFSRNSNVGNADRITGVYMGPAGEGRGFAAGFDPANYQTFTGTFPTANVFFDDNLRSPLTREVTASLGREIGASAWMRATYVKRNASDFVEDFITLADGQTSVSRAGVNLGLFDNAVYRNSDVPRRAYQAVELESAYRLGSRLALNAHWTVQLQNDGTFEGESAGGPAQPSLIGDYPEIYVPARSFPDGRLDDFQRHKVRASATYSVDMKQFGRLDLSPFYRFNSARTYSLIAAGVPLSAQQIARNPGYARLPASQSVFFGARGSQSFEGFHLVDLAATYTVPVWQSLRPWVKAELLNALNNQKLIAWNTAITADNAGPKDEDGLPLNYIKAATFGTASAPSSFPRPRPGLDGGRTLILAAGVRF
ncbi:MAG: TonB-dependent receptor [Acidobacteriota bacterium]|nr:TonB-dependent receptor [Acidobacteriota bacterium]